MNAAEAGALGAEGITALCGFDVQLNVRSGQRLLIYGASGGIGHIALQLAKRIGAAGLPVASGKDGVELVKQLGADRTSDGHGDDIAAAVGGESVGAFFLRVAMEHIAVGNELEERNAETAGALGSDG